MMKLEFTLKVIIDQEVCRYPMAAGKVGQKKKKTHTLQPFHDKNMEKYCCYLGLKAMHCQGPHEMYCDSHNSICFAVGCCDFICEGQEGREQEMNKL